MSIKQQQQPRDSNSSRRRRRCVFVFRAIKKTRKGNHKSASAEEAKTARSRMGKEDETGITTTQTQSQPHTHTHTHTQHSGKGRETHIHTDAQAGRQISSPSKPEKKVKACMMTRAKVTDGRRSNKDTHHQQQQLWRTPCNLSRYLFALSALSSQSTACSLSPSQASPSAVCCCRTASI